MLLLTREAVDFSHWPQRGGRGSPVYGRRDRCSVDESGLTRILNLSQKDWETTQWAWVLYSQAQTWPHCFHPSGEPTHLPMSHPFCSCRTSRVVTSQNWSDITKSSDVTKMKVSWVEIIQGLCQFICMLETAILPCHAYLLLHHSFLWGYVFSVASRRRKREDFSGGSNKDHFCTV